MAQVLVTFLITEVQECVTKAIAVVCFKPRCVDAGVYDSSTQRQINLKI